MKIFEIEISSEPEMSFIKHFDGSCYEKVLYGLIDEEELDDEVSYRIRYNCFGRSKNKILVDWWNKSEGDVVCDLRKSTDGSYYALAKNLENEAWLIPIEWLYIDYEGYWLQVEENEENYIISFFIDPEGGGIFYCPDDELDGDYLMALSSGLLRYKKADYTLKSALEDVANKNDDYTFETKYEIVEVERPKGNVVVLRLRNLDTEQEMDWVGWASLEDKLLCQYGVKTLEGLLIDELPSDGEWDYNGEKRFEY